MSDRSKILDEMVRDDQEAGLYDPPGSEDMRKLINEQAKEVAIWKQTVRDIFDELHFGKDSVFEGQCRLARRIVAMIEARHRDYFRGSAPLVTQSSGCVFRDVNVKCQQDDCTVCPKESGNV